jgi:hypothetical protein
MLLRRRYLLSLSKFIASKNNNNFCGNNGQYVNKSRCTLFIGYGLCYNCVSVAGKKHCSFVLIWTVSHVHLPLYLGPSRPWLMVVGFTTTYAISTYHHWCCEFESRSGRGVQHYVIKFVSDLLQVGGFLRDLRCHPPIKLTATI